MQQIQKSRGEKILIGMDNEIKRDLPGIQWFPGRLLKIKLEPLILAA
nr:MAG TPA: hypothetical protein [Caudoviricetes sp.]